jgi:hypothetical protein
MGKARKNSYDFLDFLGYKENTARRRIKRRHSWTVAVDTGPSLVRQRDALARLFLSLSLAAVSLK